MSFQFCDQIALRLEFVQNIESIVLLLDGVGKASSSPFFQGTDLAVVLCDEVFYLLNLRLDLSIFERRIDDDNRLIDLRLVLH